MTSRPVPRRPRAALLVLGLLLLGVLAPTTATAATRNGITPLAPRAGASVPSGESPTFRMRVRGRGSTWVHVCKSARRNRQGVICTEESIGRARRSGRTYTYKPRFFDFPAFWLNNPGTYYWQAHRIQCEGSTRDCRQEGPVVRFRVR